ncbi:MAG: hypothetical protein V7636_1230, partial [Actinomycetota bacterium]
MLSAVTDLRWGILATGSIASTFATHLPTSATGQLAVVASRDIDRAHVFAKRHGATRAYGTYEGLLDDADVDAVYIATPHPLHARWAIAAAAAGKHVLCEKPLAMNEAEVAAMIEAAIEHDVVLMEAFMYRCHPQTDLLLRMLREDAVGDVREIEAVHSFDGGDRLEPDGRLLSPALGGGGILDVGCYCVSGALLVAGAEPIDVIGGGTRHATGVDQVASATLTFDGGVVAHLTCGIVDDRRPMLRIVGTTGTITLGTPWLPTIGGKRTTRITLEHDGAPINRVPIVADRGLYAYQADVVAGCVERGERQGTVTWADSLATARTLDAWRHAVGVEYEADRPTTPVHGDALRVHGTMPSAHIEGVDTPVSRVVLGTMVTEHPESFAIGMSIFDAFFERGGTTFDTAHKYGEGLCDDALGWWMETRGVRDVCVVIGKGAHTPDCDPDSLTRQLHESLERLRTDHLDVYLLHRDDLDVPIGEFVDVLNEHHDAGRIRAFGGSNWTAGRIDAANEYARANGLVGMTVLSNQFSLARMIVPTFEGTVGANEPGFVAWLAERGLPNIAWSSQAAGFFSGLTPDGHLGHAWFDDDNLERRRRAETLAAERGCEPVTVALAWALRQPVDILPVIGPRHLS